MDARPPAGTWQEVATAARELPVALVLGGPHALLMLLAICAAQGVPPVAETGGGSPAGGFAEDRAARDAVLAALHLPADVCARRDLAPAARNPIGVLQGMAAGGAAARRPLLSCLRTPNEPRPR